MSRWTDSRLQIIKSSLSVKHIHLEETLQATTDPRHIYEIVPSCLK